MAVVVCAAEVLPGAYENNGADALLLTAVAVVSGVSEVLLPGAIEDVGADGLVSAAALVVVGLYEKRTEVALSALLLLGITNAVSDVAMTDEEDTSVLTADVEYTSDVVVASIELIEPWEAGATVFALVEGAVVPVLAVLGYVVVSTTDTLLVSE